ncbi:sugar phosphate isomerase/epimerase family protein [Paenibacillus harenae]|uniref:sugar phosphate isomerase/epimerase family protein n=1 Tax=Paenibacillus harenae TaxID=306543 RepID=UPI000421DFAC|nr:sugar phosphate isomerase/epimerase [Paenibacillus harenae]
MKLNLIKALWGLEGTYEEQLSRIAAAGYNGIEGPMPSPENESLFRSLLERYEFAYIPQIFTQNDHISSFAEQAERAAAFEPLLIVSHSARDCMTEQEQDRFFEEALAVEQRLGIPVGHETHRQRAMFTPWTTARLLRKFPSLHITADFSHWMNVCESHLDDQEDAIALAISRTIHIHGRVGYPEGPQVSHPAAPEYKTELSLFMGWWRRMLEHQQSQGKTEATFTAEFGPPGYMPTIPYTNEPVADLWEVNQWMTDHFAQHAKSVLIK